MIHSVSVLAMTLASLIASVNTTATPPQEAKGARLLAASDTVPVPTPAAIASDQSAESFTATYGDWQLQCGGAAGARNCQVIQTLVIKGQKAPFAQLGFGKLAKDGPLYFTAVVPVNVTFPSTVEIGLKKGDEHPTEVPFTRCLPTGCFASIEVDDALLKRWKEQDGAGSLTIKSGSGKDLTVPMSYRGLKRAMDEFDKAE